MIAKIDLCMSESEGLGDGALMYHIVGACPGLGLLFASSFVDSVNI